MSWPVTHIRQTAKTPANTCSVHTMACIRPVALVHMTVLGKILVLRKAIEEKCVKNTVDISSSHSACPFSRVATAKQFSTSTCSLYLLLLTPTTCLTASIYLLFGLPLRLSLTSLAFSYQCITTVPLHMSKPSQSSLQGFLSAWFL